MTCCKVDSGFNSAGPSSGESGAAAAMDSLHCALQSSTKASYRVLMLGDTKVGKSSIMRRFVDDDFDFNFR